MKNITIFASGAGSNAENLIRYFSNTNSARVVQILSNKPDAPVLKRAANLSVDSRFFDRHQFYETNEVLKLLIEKKTDLIVLAGFLWLVPEEIIKTFKGRIVNIHPALLPSYGGKGMYGDKVHAAVLESGDKESGITIHYVNEKYDSGDIIFQARCAVLPGDDVHSLASRVHELEYEHFPVVVEKLLEKLI